MADLKKINCGGVTYNISGSGGGTNNLLDFQIIKGKSITRTINNEDYKVWPILIRTNRPLTDDDVVSLAMYRQSNPRSKHSNAFPRYMHTRVRWGISDTHSTHNTDLKTKPDDTLHLQELSGCLYYICDYQNKILTFTDIPNYMHVQEVEYFMRWYNTETVCFSISRSGHKNVRLYREEGAKINIMCGIAINGKIKPYELCINAYSRGSFIDQKDSLDEKMGHISIKILP